MTPVKASFAALGLHKGEGFYSMVSIFRVHRADMSAKIPNEA